MTVANTMTPLNHTSDAGFVAWITEFSANLRAVGLIPTSDTGQIVLASALRPGLGGVAGYEIYRMNDTLQSTAPIFIKFEYGTCPNGSTQAAIWITAGTGSNGAGGITNIFDGRQLFSDNDSLYSFTAPYPSFWTCGEGYFAFGWKSGINSGGGEGRAGALLADDRRGDEVGRQPGHRR